MKIYFSCLLLLWMTNNLSAQSLKDMMGPSKLIGADDSRLNELEVPEIKYSKTGKSFLTYNNMGFDTTSEENNWLENAFFEFAGLHDHGKAQFLEVGCGYGNIVKKFYQHTKNARLIANDLSEEHLLISRSKLAKEELSKLTLNLASFPEQSFDNDKKFTGIMLHRVLHLLSGDEIARSLQLAYDMLTHGGKVFIAINTPLNKDYSSWFLPEYDKNIEAGTRWPGEYLPVKKALPAQTYALPEYLHVMDSRVLHPELEKLGFKIEKSDFIGMQKFQTKTKRDGREVIAVVAVKS